jgi:hypothetical protein
MPHPPSAYDLHQRERWLRHDAHLWIRHDAARFLPPGTDPAEVFPHLKRQREAAEDAAFAARIAASQRVLTMLRTEVDEMKAARARQRLEAAKYSPSQPRVPSGNSRGGQWTAGGTGGSIAQPMGPVAVGDPSGSSELTGLFHHTCRAGRRRGAVRGRWTARRPSGGRRPRRTCDCGSRSKERSVAVQRRAQSGRVGNREGGYFR